jgi:hypothetical protein|tara:strand:+ start:197 stop:520 length:324 start_codon:yes stop_codon:yes gene_type:complete
MSVKRTAFVICDRCTKTIEEVEHQRPENEPCFVLRHRLGVDSVSGFDFHDLCNKCTGRVQNLVDMIVMTGEEKPSDNPVLDLPTPSDETAIEEATNGIEEKEDELFV